MKIKKFLKLSLAAYAVGYLGLTGHVFYDYSKDNLPKIEQSNPNLTLDIHKYKIEINGKNKILTLVGEVHFYNKKDSEIARKLVDKNHNFANECGECNLEFNSFKEEIYGNFLAYSLFIPFKFNIMGNGRIYKSIDEIAREKGYKNHPLEENDDPFKNLSFGQKTMLLVAGIYSTLKGPLNYYESKKDSEKVEDLSKIKKDLDDLGLSDSLLYKRDIVMAGNIVKLLKEDTIDKLVASVGKAHIEEILRSLAIEWLKLNIKNFL